MTELLRDVLPIALGITLSPFPIIPMLLVLTGDRSRAAGGAFLAAFAGGIAGCTIALSAITDLVSGNQTQATWTGWVRVVLGIALVFVAGRAFLNREAEGETPAWMTSASTATPGAAAKLGLVLAVANPKVVIFAAAAGSVIGATQPPPGQWLAAIAAFTVVSSLGVALPYLARLVGGPRVATSLSRARDWLVARNKTVSAVVLAVIGVVVATNGLDIVRG